MRRNIQTCKVSENKREEFMQRKILSQDRNRSVILKEVENVIVSGVPWYSNGAGWVLIGRGQIIRVL